jgi:hypothetical protein
MSLAQKLIKEFGLTPQKRNITPIDYFKLVYHRKRYLEILSLHKPQTPIEEYIIKLESDPRINYVRIISQNHFYNYFSEIHFILGNEKLIHDPIFENLWIDRYYMPLIADYIISSYDSMENTIVDNQSLSKFYNQTLIDKFINCLSSFEKTNIKNPDLQKKYDIFWNDFFIPNAIRIRDFIISIKSRFTTEETCGISLFPDLYEYCVTSNISIPVKISDSTHDDIIAEYHEKHFLTTGTLEKWALKHVELIKNRIREIAKILFNIDPNMPYVDILKLFSNDSSQKFKDSDELEQLYSQEIEKLRNQFGSHFREYEKPELVVFNDKDKAGGYYFLNCFFLNKADFENMRKYEIQALTLHETVPGHHTQLSTSMFSDEVDYLTMFFWNYFNGFIEGWGLYSETLCNHGNTIEDYWNEFGTLEMVMLRTLRIVVDIRLNAMSYPVEEIISYISENLSYGLDTIKSEVYRYIVFPGQALSYRIGYEVFAEYFKTNNKRNRLDNELMLEYQKTVNRGQQPLTFLLDNQ